MEEEATPPAPRQNTLLTALKQHRVYGAAVGYLVAAWIVLQVAAIVLTGFGAPAWVLRGLMIVLAFGLGITLLAVWSRNRRSAGRPLLPRTRRGRAFWAMAILLSIALPLLFFFRRPATGPALPVGTVGAPLDKSVAVLPFDNFSEDKDSAVFAEGVQDEVLTDLSKVADLKVISRSSVLQYKNSTSRNLRDIGKTLGVAYVVEGSVQRAGGKIKVTARLINARTDAHQWAEQYVRDLSDVFVIQGEIAQAIAGQLQAAISPREHAAMVEAPTHDLQAYELYLRARQAWADFDAVADLRIKTNHVLDLLQQATARDPDFARAYAMIAEVQAFTYRSVDASPAQDALALRSAETVARLRPGSVDAHKAMGSYSLYVRHDYRRTREEFAEAVRQAPGDARALKSLAEADSRQGLWTEAADLIGRAAALDPEDETIAYNRADILQRLHRYSEAVAGLDRWLVAHPSTYLLRVAKAGMLLDWRAEPTLAREELARLPPGFDPRGEVINVRLACNWGERDFAAAERDLTASPLLEIYEVPRDFYRGFNAHYRGDAAAAAAAFASVRGALQAKAEAQPGDPRWPLLLAMTDAALGNTDAAREEARRGAALCPPEQDAKEGPKFALMLASVLASTGEYEESIRTLQALASRPNGPTYGDLRLSPEWEPLRSDGRFAALVASLSPKP